MYSLQFQLGDVVKVLTVVEERAEDASPLMADSLLLMIRSTQLNIQEQGRPTPFAPHAPSTLKRRLKQGSNPQILINSGLLMQSLGAGASGIFEAADGFGEYDESSATLGTNRPGADALQTGYPPNNLPGREYVLFQVQDDEDLLVMAEDFFTGSGPYAVV